VGFLAAQQQLVELLLDTKLLATLTTSPLFEKALAWCIDQASCAGMLNSSGPG
jgi:hypothetical protein